MGNGIPVRTVKEGSCWGTWEDGHKECIKCCMQPRCRIYTKQKLTNPIMARLSHGMEDEEEPFKCIINRIGERLEKKTGSSDDVESVFFFTADNEPVISINRSKESGEVWIQVRESLKEDVASGCATNLSFASGINSHFEAECVCDLILSRMM